MTAPAPSSTDLVVLGLGYVGLPLAQEATRAGLTVVGFDISEAAVAGLNAGRSHVDDLSDDDIAEMLAAGFRATTDATVLDDAAAAVICVPTPLGTDGGPDLGAVRSARPPSPSTCTRASSWCSSRRRTRGPPRTSYARCSRRPPGLTAGEDFHLAFSPERIDPGNAEYGLANTPKVVGGLTPACTAQASAFYGRFVDTVVEAAGPAEAETAKLLENTYRHINIALVNEMARFCHELEIDLWDVIRCASTKPFGFQAFYPGPGVGGHCIPIDPNYLSHSVRAKLGYPFRFVELAQEINATMPAYVAQRAQNLLNQHGKAIHGSTVLLLGVTYKPNIADQRESPAVPLARHLNLLGAHVVYHDPRVAEWDAGVPVQRADDLAHRGRFADLVILVQPHAEYDVAALAASSRLFFDTRGVTTGDGVHRL